MFFGCLELAEQVHFVLETVAEDQEHEDLDAEALSQLASGLKPDVPSLGAPCCLSLSGEIAELALSLPWDFVHQIQRSVPHPIPSLRLHQQLSVYRI